MTHDKGSGLVTILIFVSIPPCLCLLKFCIFHICFSVQMSVYSQLVIIVAIKYPLVNNCANSAGLFKVTISCLYLGFILTN